MVALNLRSLPHLDLANQSINIAKAFLVHPGYQGSYPPDIKHPNEVIELCTRYIEAINAAATAGGSDRRAERDALRPQVAFHTEALVHSGVRRSVMENDPSLIVNICVDQKKKPVKRSAPVPTGTPTTPKVQHGKSSGTILVSCDKVPGASAYFVSICLGDPMVEANWSEAKEFNHCRNLEVNGLEPGKVYYFRMRCLGGTGYGPWSPFVSIMALLK